MCSTDKGLAGWTLDTVQSEFCSFCTNLSDILNPLSWLLGVALIDAKHYDINIY